MKKGILILTFLILALFSVSCIYAVDVNDTLAASEETGEIELSVNDEMSMDNLQTSEENTKLPVDENDETLSYQIDAEILTADQFTYSNLREQFNSGGNVTLTAGNYKYCDGDGDTIKINTSRVIDGNGAVIDMQNSGKQAFIVTGNSYVIIKNLTIKNANNNERSGGAINVNSFATLINCNFVNNHAKYGGAVFFMNEGEVINCNFADNSASQGGAVWMNSGPVTNCSFVNNTATDNGGAVYFKSKDGDVINCNFAGNSAVNDGGAIYCSQGWAVTADTCIFKTDSDTTFNTDILQPTLNADNFTTFYGLGEKLTFDLKTNANISVTNGNISISIYHKNNGSWVGNYSFQSGEGWIVDLSPGSYYAIFNTEYAKFQPINRTITVMPANFYALNHVINANDNPIINLTTNYYFDPENDSDFVNGIVIRRVVTINGNGHTINANGKSSIFSIRSMYSVLENITFVNSTHRGYSGGAVYFGHSGKVINCNFTDNHAEYGGAVFIMEEGEVINCNFADNSASQGGAVWMNSGPVRNCSFVNNTATDNGGAVYFKSKDGDVINCNFAGNSASQGGAIYCSQGWAVTADTCIFKTDSDTTFNTDILQPTLNADNFTTFYGSSEKFTFDLRTNISSIPVTNGNISISVYFKNNGSWICNYSCLSGEGWTVDLPVGFYYAIFDTEYAEFKPVNRTITITMPDISYYVNITSLTTNNRTVNITAESNIPENLFWNGKLLFILPNGKNISANYTSNGIWWAVHRFEVYDDYKISATYPELDNVAVNNGTIRITKADSTITVDKVVFNYGDSNISVKTEGAAGITAKIDGNDVAAAGFTILISGLNIGNHTLTVTTIADEDHNPVTKTVNITVNKADCILIVNDVELYYGESKNVTVTAEGAVNITAKIDGNNVTVTGFTIPISGLNPGTHTLTVTAVPDENHTEVTGNATITVNRLKTELTGNPITTTYDVNGYLVITLKDVYGNPLSGNTVLVDLNGVKTYTTDNNGQVKVPTKALAAKVYTARITFDGDAKYEKSSMDVKVTVNKAANPLKVKGKTLKVKFSKLKKKAVKVKVTKVVKFTKKGVGTLTYKKVKGNKKITINKKTGKVTIKKGLKKGNYKVKMKIKAKGNANYKPSAFKTITFKIKCQ